MPYDEMRKQHKQCGMHFQLRTVPNYVMENNIDPDDKRTDRKEILHTK